MDATSTSSECLFACDSIYFYQQRIWNSNWYFVTLPLSLFVSLTFIFFIKTESVLALITTIRECERIEHSSPNITNGNVTESHYQKLIITLLYQHIILGVFVCFSLSLSLSYFTARSLEHITQLEWNNLIFIQCYNSGIKIGHILVMFEFEWKRSMWHR